MGRMLRLAVSAALVAYVCRRIDMTNFAQQFEAQSPGWLLVAAPVGTPAPIVNKVSADLAKVLNEPDVKKKLLATGSYAKAMTPEQTLAFVDSQQDTWLPVLKNIPAR